MAPKKPGKSPAKKPPTPKKPATRTRVAGKAASVPAKRPRRPPTPKRPPARPAKPKAADAPQLGLTAKQQRFVDEYLIDLNATQAAVRAGYSTASAGAIGHENLKKPEIQLAITEGRKAQQARTETTADSVLAEIAAIALADTRELVEIRVGCCRHCHGEGHRRQRTVGEMNRDRAEWIEVGKAPAEFDEEGGIGFNPLLPPDAECPECGGDGQPRVVLKDTRHLSRQATALYAGAKQTKDGIEIKMHSKGDALERLARHVGLYEKDNRQKTDPLAALLNRIASGNGNGFKPVAVDPEAPTQPPLMSGFQTQQDIPTGDDE